MNVCYVYMGYKKPGFFFKKNGDVRNYTNLFSNM